MINILPQIPKVLDRHPTVRGAIVIQCRHLWEDKREINGEVTYRDTDGDEWDERFKVSKEVATGHSAGIRLDEFAYKPHVHQNTKPLFGLPSFDLPAPRSLLTITRADLEEAPVDWLESMRRKLAAKHGVPVEQVCFDQMTHSDRAIFGEFRVRKAAPASPVV